MGTLILRLRLQLKLIVSCEFQYHYSTVLYPLNHKRLKYGFQWQIHAIIKYQTFKTKMSLTGTKTKTKNHIKFFIHFNLKYQSLKTSRLLKWVPTPLKNDLDKLDNISIHFSAINSLHLRLIDVWIAADTHWSYNAPCFQLQNDVCHIIMAIISSKNST